MEQIQNIKTDEWPKQNMKDYIRLRKELSFTLEEVKKDLRKRIAEEYDKTYAQLEDGCVQQSVDKAILPAKDMVIRSKTQSENILVLQSNLSTDAFFAEQSERILKAALKPGVGTPPTQHTVNKVLTTRTSAPLKTEEDVDCYLQQLKKQIMNSINEGNSVMIIK